MSSWIVYHGDSLILSNSCASILFYSINSTSYGASQTEVSPKSSQQMSLAAGRINFFFFWKTPKFCLLMQDPWSPCGKAILKFHGFVVLPGRHILYRVGLENVNHLLQWTHNSRRTLGIFFKMQLSSSAFLRGEVLKLLLSHHWVFPSFQRSSLAMLVFHSFWQGLACGLTKTMPETVCSTGKRHRQKWEIK